MNRGNTRGPFRPPISGQNRSHSGYGIHNMNNNMTNNMNAASTTNQTNFAINNFNTYPNTYTSTNTHNNNNNRLLNGQSDIMICDGKCGSVISRSLYNCLQNRDTIWKYKYKLFVCYFVCFHLFFIVLFFSAFLLSLHEIDIFL